MKGKIVRTLAMTVAAISLLSVSAYAKQYNTSRISKTANRILKGTEGEGAATVFQGGVDTIVSTNELTDPEEVKITYNYDNKSDTVTKTVRTTKWNWTTPTHTQHPYTVETRSANGITYVYWRVTDTKADPPYKTRVVIVEPTAPTLTKDATAKSLTYTSKAQALVNAGAATNGVVQYKLNNGSWSTSIPTATNAGTYTVYFNAKGNKSSTTATKSVTVTINKAASTYTTAPAAKALTYSGEAQALVTTGTATGGTVQYSLDNSNWSTAIPTAADAGTYTVYYKVDGNTNYNGIAENSVTATISKADADYIAEPEGKTIEWTGAAQELVSAGTANGGTVQYKLDDGGWSTAIPTAMAVGSYTVSYKVVGDANHNDIAEKSVTVTINKANSTYTTEPAAKENLTYSGTAQELVTAGTATGGTVQYKLGDGSYSTAVPTAADAGTYTVYYKVDGNTNYNGIAENSVTATISKADAELTTEPAVKELTWTGTAQELVSAGAANGGTVQYKLGDGEWSTAVPTATDVGTYTVYYKAAGDTDHNDTAVKSVTVTIGAKAAEATYKNIMDFGGEDYDGEASAWTVTVTPGSTAIESVDVKVNGKNSNGQWDNNTAISGGPMIFGVVVKAAAYKVESMTAVVNGSDIEATLDTKPID